MGIVKFKTGYSIDKIERVEVLRETDKCVYLPTNSGYGKGVDERREAKSTEYAQYHDTWADAHTHLLKKAEGRVKAARLHLETVNGQLGTVKGMKPPKVQP